MPKINTLNMNLRGTPGATTPKEISLLSPDIYDRYYISKSTMSLTPDKTTPNKNSLPDIRKVTKNDHRDKLLDPKKSDSHDKQPDNDSAPSRTLYDASEGATKFSPNEKIIIKCHLII